jgi:[ribosomal protein S5]-alanine N-acetyltransferase
LRTLVTSRCTLEPLVAAHAREMFSVLSDPAIYEFENGPPVSVEWLSQRYEHLERRRSADDTEMWLNWAVRLPDGQLAGYVEATVLPSAAACVAYELSSRYWRQGIGSSAVTAMLEELHSEYRVDTFVAALKSANVRSFGLLRSLGFSVAKEQRVEELRGEPDEVVMIKSTTQSGPGP